MKTYIVGALLTLILGIIGNVIPLTSLKIFTEPKQSTAGNLYNNHALSISAKKVIYEYDYETKLECFTIPLILYSEIEEAQTDSGLGDEDDFWGPFPNNYLNETVFAAKINVSARAKDAFLRKKLYLFFHAFRC